LKDQQLKNLVMSYPWPEGNYGAFLRYLMDALINCRGAFISVRGEDLRVGIYGAIGEKIVTLAEVVELAKICANKPTLGICLDYTDDEIGEEACAASVIEVLEDSGVNYIIFSRNLGILEMLHRDHPDIETGRVLTEPLSRIQFPLKGHSQTKYRHLVVLFEESHYVKILGVEDAIEMHSLDIQLWVAMEKFIAYCNTMTRAGIGIITENLGSWQIGAIRSDL